MNVIDALVRQPAAEAVGWTLLQFVWQGAAIGLAVGAVLFLLRRGGADVRYVVASIGLALMLTMPAVTAVQKFDALNAASSSAAGTPIAREHGTASNTVAGASTDVSAEARSTAPLSAPALRTPKVRAITAPRVDALVPAALLVWFVGVLLLSARLVIGWLWVQRLRSRGILPDDRAWQRVADRLRRELHIRRAIRVLESTLVDVPTVVGWLRPVVLLPLSALAGLAPAQLEAILAHELAHVRRHDYLVNLLQTLVETLLFYHPAVWWVSRRIRIERENCCDDLAVSLCGDPIAYANALADLESLRSSIAPSRGRHRAALAATGGSLIQRVRRLLGAPSHAAPDPAWAAGTVVLVAIACLAFSVDGVRAQTNAGSAIAARAEAPYQSPDEQVTASEIATRVREAMEQAEETAQGIRDTATHTRETTERASESARRAREAATRAREATARAEAKAQRDREWIEKQMARATAGLGRMAADLTMDRSARAATEVASAASRTRAAGQTAAAATRQAQADMRAAETAAASASAGAQADAVMAQAAVRNGAAAIATAATASAGQSIDSNQHGSSGNWIWSNNGEKLEVTYSGTFDFTDDDADVRSMSPGGLLRISDGAWFGRHSVEIREHAGQIERRYYVNGIERPFDPEGRQWLQENLPKFIRNTAIDAPERVARL
ncbi:MAG TPA: M56 family metallopeptidase, partial [Vicinamibacterales bacterium]